MQLVTSVCGVTPGMRGPYARCHPNAASAICSNFHLIVSVGSQPGLKPHNYLPLREQAQKQAPLFPNQAPLRMVPTLVLSLQSDLGRLH